MARSRQTGGARVIQWTRPWMYPKQLEAIFNESRYSVTEASTKSGKTAACMIWLLEQAMGGSVGWNYWWVAPTFAQAKIVWRRLKVSLSESLPGLVQFNETELYITLPNGALMMFKGADRPDSLYGEDVHAAVIDEGSRMREEAWHAVRSTVTATKGPIRIIGNVKGKKNWFYSLARRAEYGEDPQLQYHRITAYDAIASGVLDDAEIRDAKDKLPDHVFRELYMAEASDDGGNPFGLEAIKQCLAPLSHELPVCWGWDLAKKRDWTVGIALDQSGYVCRFLRFRKPWEETIDTILQETGTARSMLDSTGAGDAVVEAVQRNATGKGDNFEGFKFSLQSKQQLMEGLAVSIQSYELHFPEGIISDELESVEYEYTKTGVRYTVPSGYWDDCVMALGLARRCWLGMPKALEGWDDLTKGRRIMSHFKGVRAVAF